MKYDLKDICPNYTHLTNKVDFWADFLKEIAGRSSQFYLLTVERTSLDETAPQDSQFFNRGLFQIDQFTAKRYRCASLADLGGPQARQAVAALRVSVR